MKIGLLWYDADPKADLKAKIERAATYYAKKYGQVPNLCFVHPTMLPNGDPPAGLIAIRTHRFVRPNQFWIGVSQEVANG